MGYREPRLAVLGFQLVVAESTCLAEIADCSAELAPNRLRRIECKLVQAPLASESTSPPSYEVEDQDDHRQYKKKMNQAAGNMHAKTQQPQYENDHKDCPEHCYSFAAVRAHENCKPSQAPATIGN